VLNDFRSGALGRITLETPEEHLRWAAAAQAREALRPAKKVRGAGASMSAPAHPTEERST